MTAQALEGVRGLEYCGTLAGAYCTKLMSDMGAEGIKVEPPETGDVARNSPPFPDDVSHPEKSGLFLFVNTNKLGITLNPSVPEGRKIFEKLAGEVDVVVEDWPLGHMESIELGYERLRELDPGLIVASITPFGRSGPFKDYRARTLNVSHVSGQGYLLPLPSPDLERAPVQMGGNSTDYDIGQTASVAILAALFSKGTTGKGQLIEVSGQEAALSLQRVEGVIYANSGQVSNRLGPKTERGITRLVPCKDGHVIMVTPLDHQKESLARLVGAPVELAKNSGMDTEEDAANIAALTERVREWMKDRPGEEISHEAQALSCPITTMSSAEDVKNSRQMNSRGFFIETDHPVAGKLEIPGVPYRFLATPSTLERAAPLLGEHNEEILCERLGYGREELKDLEEAGAI